MRVLFTTVPEKSIFQYVVPLAWALRTAGHEVRVASSPQLTAAITQAGLTAVPVGSDRDLWHEAEPSDYDEIRKGIPSPYDVAEHPEKATWDYLRPASEESVSLWHKPENFPMTADLVAFARHWRPDLVIWEDSAYAGPIAARAVGAAHGRFLFSVDVFGVTREHFLRVKNQQPPGERADPMADWLGGYARRSGTEFTEDMITGQFTVDQFPRSLQLHTASVDYIPMRHVPYGGPATVPKWLWEEPKRPRVAFTLGMVATDFFNGYVVDVQQILDSVADLEIEFVATLSDSVKSGLRAIPDNVVIVPYAPLHHLAPTCAAVIHHAGAATMATTSLYGIPQLALPYHFDQPILGRRLAHHGAGLTISTAETTGQSVRDNLVRLLDEPAFQSRAADLREEMFAMPTANQLVPRLEELTEKYRTRLAR